MDAELIAMQLFSGIALGAILIMVALGLSIIFGMLGVVNFAHGALFMVGAYAGLWVASLTGSFWWGLLVAPLAVGVFGMAIEYLLIRPLYGRSVDDPLLLTFGLGYVLVEAVRIVFGSDGIPSRRRRNSPASPTSASASSRSTACSSSRWSRSSCSCSGSCWRRRSSA